jgi:hypothetical protein
MRKTKYAKLSLLALIITSTINIHASFIPLGQTNYIQDFNSLASSGKSKVLPNGWSIQEYGDEDNQIPADNGRMSLGGIYSYGASGSTDRALGTLTDSDGNSGIFGASFQNAGSRPINQLFISYTGEEWRLGVAGHQNRLEFQYSLNARGLTDHNATWLNAPALDFLTPNLMGVGAHDGNAASNQRLIASTISFLNIPQGGTFWVRWQEVGVANGKNGDGLAVDNFSISAVPEASTDLAAFAALILIGWTFWTKRHSLIGDLA